jgi:peptidoglycan-associated lipoprotein
MTTKLMSGFLGMALSLTACSKDAPPPQAPTGTETPEPKAEAVLEQHPEKAPTRAQIQISDRIRKACGITETDAFFDFDSAAITPTTDRVLGQLATCFTTGPLAGQGMKLVGHADPRGESEYNLVLGGKRADHVSAALAKKGLVSDKMMATSRGEMDALGNDEAGWARDRKVEVLLDE